jgi:hypothetical protein
VDQAPDRPPILFISQFGQPGDYDPLSAAADLSRGGTRANGHDTGHLGANDEGEEGMVAEDHEDDLLVVSGI